MSLIRVNDVLTGLSMQQLPSGESEAQGSSGCLEGPLARSRREGRRPWAEGILRVTLELA